MKDSLFGGNNLKSLDSVQKRRFGTQQDALRTLVPEMFYVETRGEEIQGFIRKCQRI